MLKTGIAKIDITPRLGIRLAGYGVPERPAESVHDPLYATAIVFDDGDRIAAHVTIDVCQIGDADLIDMRRAASDSSGIPADNINIGVSHTHSGPQTFSFDGWGDKDDEYLEILKSNVAQAVKNAYEQRQPVRVGFGSIPTQTGINRRSIGRDSVPYFGGNEDGPYDPTMTVVRFESEAGPLATLIHCAAHCTAMGNNRLISRDWAGVMTGRVESQTRSTVIFINGSYGDTGPRTNVLTERGLFSAGTGDGIHAVNEVGYRAAGDALRAFQSIRSFDHSLRLNTLTETLNIPLAPLPPRSESEAKLRAYEPVKDTWGAGMCNYRYWKRVVAAHDSSIKTHLEFRQTILTLGPLALVPMPGEPFTSISLRLRRLSPFQYTLACGGTNGMLSYLPDREARARGGYEAWVSIGTLTQLLAENADDALVNENVSLLERMRSESVC